MPLLSHYGDIPDISDKLVYPSIVFAVVTPLVVLARFVSRKWFSGILGLDDWVIIVSSMIAEVVSIQMLLICEGAFGKHIDQIEDKQIIAKTLKVYFVAQLLYKVNLGLTKTSILFLYLRIFVTRWFQRTCQICLAIVIAFTIGTVMSSIFQCTPVARAFDHSKEGTCINMTTFWYLNAGFNILSDLVLIFLPIPVIVKLQLPTQQKILLCGIFAVGIFVCITSILRLSSLNIATSHHDITWNSISSSIWTIIESNLGIICACLPALQPIISGIFPCIRMATYNRSYRSYNYGTNRYNSRQGYNLHGSRIENDRWNELQEPERPTSQIMSSCRLVDDDVVAEGHNNNIVKTTQLQIRVERKDFHTL
ncbi:putative plasma membrane protein Pth11-like protein [Talaromyces proteolyticus]|uniref:Plasma membrane protein Pth11-like protein n=1 Tax=Talaromyces proteolyticus TaxID=1131652 RepID=A0AAD4PTS3_9EURO|nr:putative plasma membrane protein Pth11-like protein [Talaromyces proteolyticus]KAH8689164.1 putative plasma membrane protein Pth11-like protein [Talaromyces proteolyticus]